MTELGPNVQGPLTAGVAHISGRLCPPAAAAAPGCPSGSDFGCSPARGAGVSLQNSFLPISWGCSAEVALGRARGEPQQEGTMPGASPVGLWGPPQLGMSEPVALGRASCSGPGTLTAGSRVEELQLGSSLAPMASAGAGNASGRSAFCPCALGLVI